MDPHTDTSGVSSLRRYLPPLSENGARWARFFGVLVAIAALAWLARALQGVLTPLVAAWAIAYMLNPAVVFLEKRGVKPAVSASLGLLLMIGGALVALLAGITQLVEFGGQLPGYISRAQVWIDHSLREWQSRWADVDLWPEFAASQPSSAPAGGVATQPSIEAGTAAHAASATTRPAALSVNKSLSDAARTYGLGFAQSLFLWLTGLLTNAFYWVSAGVLLPLYTWFFIVNFRPITDTVRSYLPEAYRDVILRVAGTIHSAISNFFRGRLIVSMAIGTCMAIGWTILRVPYSIPLGAMAGLLSLVPFLSVLALPPALILTYLRVAEVNAAGGNENWVMPVMLVMGVYLAVQALESFVFSPIVESKTNGLHPVTTVVALLIGNELAGLLGMLLAIPIASTIKSLGNEYLMPEIRRVAGLSPLRAGPTVQPYDLSIKVEPIAGEPAQSNAANRVDPSQKRDAP